MNERTLRRARRFVESWLQERYDQEDVPGFVAAIAQQGQLVLNRAYGYADLERSVPMQPDHVFRIASHSKTFTSTAIMMLADAGKLRIDDPAADYVPWLQEHRDPRWKRVTLRQLLSHGAGVIRDGLDTSYWYLGRPFPETDRFIREMQDSALILDNNTQMKYTNYGYTLLGLVIEAVSGESYNEFVLEHIIRPLGLTHTFPEYRPGLGQPDPDQLVTGYTAREQKRRLPIQHINTASMSPATGFCSTAADLCTYFTAHMTGSGQLLSDESKKEMQRAQWPMRTPGRPDDTYYGLGFMLKQYGERRTFGHSGGFPGCITNSQADPEDQLVVVVLTNCADGPAASLTAGIYAILNWFQEHDEERAGADEWASLEGSYANLMGHFRIVDAGGQLYSVYSAAWEPFALVERLEHVHDHTFKIAGSSSGGSEGELVHFTLEQGRVTAVRHAGALSLPIREWQDYLSARSAVTLEGSRENGAI